MKRLTKIFSFTTSICLKNVLGKNLENVFSEGELIKKQILHVFFRKQFWGRNFWKCFDKYLS